MSRGNRVGIIGAGSVGANLAIMLAKSGFEVVVFEKNTDILLGAPIASFINHGDGFEYYKAGHQITGMHCIDGAIAKALLYPTAELSTGVVSKFRPIRFLVSSQAHTLNITPLERFYENAEFMQNYFSQKYHAIESESSYSSDHLDTMLLRNPNSFYSKLKEVQYNDVNDVVGGCAGSSYGVNMAAYYSLIKAAIKKFNVHFISNVLVQSIEKKGVKVYINTLGESYIVDYLVVATSHKIPDFKNKIFGTAMHTLKSGTFFLNSMTILKLPPTSNLSLVAKLHRINFILQGEFGCMYACIKAPTSVESGFAAIYSPSVSGSQLFSNIYDKKYSISNPEIWDQLISEGLPNQDEAVVNTLKKAYHFYPFLQNYAEVLKTFVRPVFNNDLPGSNKGFDRRVRQLSSKPFLRSSDSSIAMYTSPKWTNSELVALQAFDEILNFYNYERIPRNETSGLGPLKLDVARFSYDFHFRNDKVNKNYEMKYYSYLGINK